MKIKMKKVTSVKVKAGSIITFSKKGKFFEGMLKENTDPENLTPRNHIINISIKGKPKELPPKYTTFKRGDFVMMYAEHEYEKIDHRAWIAKVTKSPYENKDGALVFDSRLIYIRDETCTWKRFERRLHKGENASWWKGCLCYYVDRVLTKEELEHELFLEVL